VSKRALSFVIAWIGNRNREFFPEEHREDVDTGPLLLETLNRTVMGVVVVVVVAASMFISCVYLCVSIYVYMLPLVLCARKSLCGDFFKALYPLGSHDDERLTFKNTRGRDFMTHFHHEFFCSSIRLNELAFAAPRAAFLGIVREF
jgi:hypothetical protein